MTRTAELSVVIVNYNTAQSTADAVRSLLETTRTPLEVIVVDNGSSDDSVDLLRAGFPDVDVIEAGENLGFAAGVNLGVARSRAPYVLLLNPDTTSLPGAVDALMAFAKHHPHYGLYGGRTLRPDGTLDPSSCWGAMSIWSLFCFATGLSTVFKRSAVFDPESLGSWARDAVREVPIITGCLLLISRSAWDDLGGMDEHFFLYGEDADFSRRARRAGHRPVIVPDATIVHAVGGSTASSGRKMCLVMAGRATELRLAWRAPARTIGLLLLQAGALLRRSHPTWKEVWHRRRDWRDGYPHARGALLHPSKTTTSGAS
ncbi:glycosyltransferase family 2 protein [Microbacterium caowuchunii]|uniref:Glycosyltransferase family 2 protein n=1 Tax=Microbacterium caowuchunii TaxID=2614638 RepID=A0A5N0TFM5_9MICO|nr:glycosyltransferase family 2 protein [Microbacterium caowuchunii]KAA9132917.1 glycosyltransferase family 2 protein [Microbacterium caowuchunii]